MDGVATEISLEKHPVTGEVTELCKALPKSWGNVLDLVNWAAEENTKVFVRGKRHFERRKRSLKEEEGPEAVS